MHGARKGEKMSKDGDKQPLDGGRLLQYNKHPIAGLVIFGAEFDHSAFE